MINKIILDTNVLVSALVFGKSCEECLLTCIKQSYKLYFSIETLQEWKNKVYGGRLSQILAKSKRNLTQNQIDQFFQNLVTYFVLESNISCQVSICRDPKDNKFLELARTIQADYIISGDKNLLELKQFGSTKILKPSEFMEIVKSE